MGILSPAFVALSVGVLMADEVDKVGGQVTAVVYDIKVGPMVLVEGESKLNDEGSQKTY